MFNEPSEKEVNLLPLVVHGISRTEERTRHVRNSGFGTCGQISLSVSGTGSFTDSFKRVHTINPGDIFFVAPEAQHSYEPVISPWVVDYVIFSGNMLNDIFHSFNIPPSGVISAKSDSARIIADLFPELQSAYTSGTPSRHLIASAYIYWFLFLFFKNSPSNSKKLDAEIAKLEPAIHFIKNHFDDCNLTSEMIAQNAGISHPHLCRLFSSVYGISPHDYLVQTRIDHAKLMLSEQKSISINQIASATGFNSVSYFTNVFKAKTGVTPAVFRRQTTYDFK